jgi:hypothetical protein
MNVDLFKRFGVNPDDMPSQFDNKTVAGRILLLDGDAFAYEASAGVAKLETAIRRYTTKVLEAMFLSKASVVRIHLTPSGCMKNNRHLLLGVKPYQGNRSGKAKPQLLEPLRRSLKIALAGQNDMEVFENYDIEADDGLMIDAYTLGKDAIMWSADKDLRIAPCPHYEFQTGLTHHLTDRYGWLYSSRTEAGQFKCLGYGTKFFWAQMLMGDTADNVKGIIKYDGKLCGAAAAYNILKDVPTEDAAANLVIDGYRAINQNPLPEGAAMWLLRSRDDSFAGYVWSLNLSEQNRAFILRFFNEKWCLTQDEYDDLQIKAVELGTNKEDEPPWEV